MAQVTYSFRLDETLKREVEDFCEDVGMNLSTAIMVCLKRIARERRIPFELSSEPNYNEVTRKAIEDVNAGRNLIGPFSSYADLKAALDAEDDDDEEV